MAEMIRLHAGNIDVAIGAMGAQLSSLRLSGREYLWQGDPAFWPRQAPILFPIVGSLREGRANSAQGPCTMGRHGVARNYLHEVVERAADGSSVTFELQDSEETRKAYPYRFKLNMVYAITGEATLSQTFRVTNTGDVPLPFCVGGHPAFNVPVPAEANGRGEAGNVASSGDAAAHTNSGCSGAVTDATDEAEIKLEGTFEDHELRFSRPWSCTLPVIGEDGLMNWDDAIECPKGSDRIGLSHDLFAHDALMFTDVPDSTIALRDTKSGHGVRVNFPGFKYIGVWSAAGNAPFVALEPWTGHTTAHDEDDILEHKAGMTLLEPGDVDERTFSITLF